MTQGDGLVDIKGAATNVEDVYSFFRTLKDSLISKNLKLQKLEMQAGSVDELLSSSDSQVYEFEITNMTKDQLAALFGKLLGKDGEEIDPNSPEAKQNAGGNKDNGLLSKIPIPDISKK